MRLFEKKVSRKKYEQLQRKEYAAKHLADTLAKVNNANEGRLRAAEKYIGFLAMKGGITTIHPEGLKEFCKQKDVKYYLDEEGILRIEVTEKAKK